jgi:hypothetical protein
MLALGCVGKTLMKCRAAAVAVLLSTIFASSNADARGPYGTISVGNWQGGAYTNDETGSFTHCAAGARYASGVSFSRDDRQQCGWSLGFMHEQWKLTTGAAFPLTLTFDGQQPFNVHGVPIADKLVRVPMPSNSSLIAQFRKAKAMTAYTQGQLFQFNLDQTGTAIAGIGALRCQGQAIGLWPAPAISRSFPAASRPPRRRRIRRRPSPNRSLDQKGTGFLVSTETGHLVGPMRMCAGLRRRHPGQSTVRRGARQSAAGVERRDQTIFCACCRPRSFKDVANQGQGDPVRRQRWWRSAYPFPWTC